MEQFFPEFFAGQGLPAEQRIVAANDGVLELGQHSLHFVYAPHGTLAGGHDDL